MKTTTEQTSEMSARVKTKHNLLIIQCLFEGDCVLI